MQREYFANNADSTLDGSITSSATTLVVIDGSKFPAGGFRISIQDEILYCLARTGNSMSLVRGVEGTTAASHASGTPITHLLTAGAVEQLKLDAFAMMGLGRKPTTGNTYGDEFDDDNFTGWTAVNNGTNIDTIIEKDHFASLYMPQGATSNVFNSYMKNCGTRSSGDWIAMGVRMWFPASGYPQPTLWFADGNTYGAGNQVGFAYSPHENTFVLRSNQNYNSQNGFNNQGGAGYVSALSVYDMNMRLYWLGGSTYQWEYSLDGLSWHNSGNQSANNNFTPTYCGFGFTSWGSSYPACCAFRYFRTSF